MLAAALPAAAQQSYQVSEESMTPKKREIDFYARRSWPFGRIPQNARQSAIESAARNNAPLGKRSRALSSARWRLHGPSSVGGRVRSIAMHPSDGRTLWIGAADGGVWRSTDAGANWLPIMDNENSIAMGAIAVAPSDPGILYAGTGEHTSNVDAYLGAGIMKTTDGGARWSLAGLGTVGAFSRIVVHPTNPDIVLAGGTKNGGGFYRTSDGGRNWIRVPGPKGVSDITMNPRDPEEIWIGTLSQGVMHSSDGGRTFAARNEGISLRPEEFGRTSIQVAPSDPDILYALVVEVRGSFEYAARIFKTTNKGLEWSPVFTGTGSSNFLNGQGWYNSVIAVRPDDPEVVYAGGVKVVRSTNGGADWTRVGGAHDDHHAMAFNPVDPDILYDANDGGIYRLASGDSLFRAMNNGLAITQFFGIDIDQRVPSLTFGGTQDNGTLHNSSTSYGEVAGGDGGEVVVDPIDTSRLFGEYQEGSLWRYDRTLDQLRSIMDGIDRSDDSPPWIAPLTIDPRNNQVLYTGRKHVYKTTNAGDLWEPVTGLIGNVSAIAVSTADNRVVWAGTETGAVWVSRNGGADWLERSFAPGIVNRWVTDFAPSNEEPGTAYMSVAGFLSAHIVKTTDYGESWMNVGAGLPDIPVNALAIDPGNSRVVYAGTDIGMFITTDGGGTWTTFNEGLPRVVVTDLKIHTAGGMLRAATHGRSIWEIELAGRNPAPAILSPAGGEIWTRGRAESIRWSGFTAPVRIEYTTDDGAGWKEIRSGVGGTGMLWGVDAAPSMFARIRITGSGSGEQVVSRTFTIEELRVGSVIAATAKPVVPYAIGYDGVHLWAADFRSRRMLKLDPSTLATVEVIENQLDEGNELITDLAWVPERGTFFVNRLATATGGGGWLYEMERTGEQVGRWASPAEYPVGLAWLGGDSSSTQYLLLSDRNGADQTIYLIDPRDPSVPALSFPRRDTLPNGPRGASAAGADGKHFWQVITDFSGGGSLLGATARRIDLETQDVDCIVELASGELASGIINARGVEFDPLDRNLWVSDFHGNIWKMVTCEGLALAHDTTTSAPVERAAVTGITLEQNAPNPVSSTTSIRLVLARPEEARLVVHDMSGRLVAVLHDGRVEAGEHVFAFDTDGLAAGVYRYSVVVTGGSVSRRMVVIR
jgi:photosystem II stability/assembly factor-like uncharacterized protein